LAMGWEVRESPGQARPIHGHPARSDRTRRPFALLPNRCLEEGRCSMFSLIPRRKGMMTPRFETPFTWMPEEFEHLFNRLFTRWPLEETAEWPLGWGMTTEEKEKEVVIRFELPGFEPPELKVEITGGVLTVEAEHKEPEGKEKEEKKPERKHMHVKRVLTLPTEVEPEKVVAVYKNGVLEVSLPRKPEMTPHRIEVKT